MRAVIGLVGRHELAVGRLPMDDSVEIGKCRAKGLVETPGAVPIGRAVGLGRMVEEVGREELLEDIEVSTALHFFGVPPDDGLRRLA